MTTTERKAYIDILKGILIILVVVGHAVKGDTAVHQFIYWFHMPAFFMVSGYLYKERPFDKEWMLKMMRAYVLPYFAFCLAIFAVFRFEFLPKYLLRITRGGDKYNAIHISILVHKRTFCSAC